MSYYYRVGFPRVKSEVDSRDIILNCPNDVYCLTIHYQLIFIISNFSNITRC
jgi:hypothetical protein